MLAWARWIVMLMALCASPAFAQLSFSLRTGNDATKSQAMVFDSNKCASTTSPAGPRSMYLGGRVTNGGAVAAENVTVSLSGLTNGFILTGGQPAVLSLGSIGPGQSAGAYWFIGYGCTEVTSNPIVSVSSSLGNAATNLSITGTSTLSANATGFLESSTLGPGAVVGQTIELDIQYSFGGTSVGDEFYLQPSGTQLFNAGCFRLAGTKIVQSAVTGIALNTQDRIYFQQTAKQTQKATVTVKYYFQYLCQGASTTVRPYAQGTSGTQLKYTGNYDSAATTFTIAFPSASNPFTITKTANKANSYIGVPDIIYTITISNPSPYKSTISSFTDTLPPGAKFVGLTADSDVTAANSSSTPANGDSGTLEFSGIPDNSYTINAGGSVTLKYAALMPNVVGTHINSAKANFGSASTPLAQHVFQMGPAPPLTLVKSSTISADPLNGAANAKAIPGAKVTYAILVGNPYLYSVENGSIILVDQTPANLEMIVANPALGGAPVMLQDGSPASGLTLPFTSLASQTDNVDFSNDGGASWTYVPVPDADGGDANITTIRLRPTGIMPPNSSFGLLFTYLIL